MHGSERSSARGVDRPRRNHPMTAAADRLSCPRPSRYVQRTLHRDES
jgi:hypothetical protein